MRYDIDHRPSFAQVTLELSDGETAEAEPGAMVGMTDGIEMSTETSGDGLLGAAKSMLGGESAFVNTFEATEAGELKLAGPLPGDISAYELDGDTLYVQSGGFLAATGDVDLDSEWGGATGFFTSGSLVLLRLSGTGTVFLSSYGAIEPVEVPAGETYVVDTGHVVAFQDELDYSMRRAGGGLKSSLFGDEGFVCEFDGPGTVLMQTRDFESLVGMIQEHIPGGDGAGGGGGGVDVDI